VDDSGVSGAQQAVGLRSHLQQGPHRSWQNCWRVLSLKGGRLMQQLRTAAHAVPLQQLFFTYRVVLVGWCVHLPIQHIWRLNECCCGTFCAALLMCRAVSCCAVLCCAGGSWMRRTSTLV